MTVPEARCNVRLRRYEPRTMRFPVGDRCLSVAIPAGRDYLRRGEWAAGFGEDDEPPYWVEVWPASLAAVWALARCDRSASPLAGLRVLDLGCGLGLPGVAAASRGAHVTFSDREADALAFAEWNARRLAPPASEISSAFGDWRELRLAGRFDVILLADVSYRTDSHDALLELVGRALAPGGAVLHADPERVESSRFLRRLGARFTGAQGSRQVSLRGRQTRIRLVLAGRKGGLAGTWAAHLGWMK